MIATTQKKLAIDTEIESPRSGIPSLKSPTPTSASNSSTISRVRNALHGVMRNTSTTSIHSAPDRGKFARFWNTSATAAQRPSLPDTLASIQSKPLTPAGEKSEVTKPSIAISPRPSFAPTALSPRPSAPSDLKLYVNTHFPDIYSPRPETVSPEKPRSHRFVFAVNQALQATLLPKLFREALLTLSPRKAQANNLSSSSAPSSPIQAPLTQDQTEKLNREIEKYLVAEGVNRSSIKQNSPRGSLEPSLLSPPPTAYSHAFYKEVLRKVEESTVNDLVGNLERTEEKETPELAALKRYLTGHRPSGSHPAYTGLSAKSIRNYASKAPSPQDSPKTPAVMGYK